MTDQDVWAAWMNREDVRLLSGLAEHLNLAGIPASLEQTGGWVPAVITPLADGREIMVGYDATWLFSIAGDYDTNRTFDDVVPLMEIIVTTYRSVR